VIHDVAKVTDLVETGGLSLGISVLAASAIGRPPGSTPTRRYPASRSSSRRAIATPPPPAGRCANCPTTNRYPIDRYLTPERYNFRYGLGIRPAKVV
jgi:hypothetical protein